MKNSYWTAALSLVMIVTANDALAQSGLTPHLDGTFVSANYTWDAGDEEVAAESYPEPFNAGAAIRYELVVEGPVTVRIFDALGREVATLVDETQPRGTHTTRFEAAGLPSGVYLYRVTTAKGSATGHMHLVK